VRRVDRDPARLFLRSRVDLVVLLRRRAADLASVMVIAAVNVVLPWST
jgi:hypothetical protein